MSPTSPCRVLLAGLLAASALSDGADPDERDALTGVARIRADARALESYVETDLGLAFLRATAALPQLEVERELYYRRDTRAALSVEAAEALSDEELEGYSLTTVGEEFYYNTLYGTPLAYVRALELAARHGFESAEGRRVVDFGYGGIGHLRLLASLGADAVGIEVSELLRELYAWPSDTGPVPRADARSAGEGDGARRPGSVTLLHGSFPADAEVARAVGTGADLFLSKNVLKKGYVHPEREADPRLLVDLGVEDATFLRAVAAALAPGGLFVVYNLYPPQNPPDQPYIPYATGGFPFERELAEAHGFDVLAFDVVDDGPIRELAHRLGWDRGASAMELDTLFAKYTVLRKRGG